jgi:heme ABC exporter ATP-binding subunit CcmA
MTPTTTRSAPTTVSQSSLPARWAASHQGETPDDADTQAGGAPNDEGSQRGRHPQAIVVERLTKVFDARPVLRGVSFTLGQGRTLALLGPNGAGKSTLLRILATLSRPTGGRVTVMGHDLAREANAARWAIGYLGHQTGLYDELTARENLLFFARMYGLRDGAKRADALLARVGLRARANDRVGKFSRGQAQRLALARGMLHDPAVLLLDEPDTGLDEDALALLSELLDERTRQGQTTLFTTHQLARGLAQSHQTLVLLRGRVAYDGPSAALDLAAVRDLYGGEA